MESLACLFVCERVRKRLFSDLISLPLHSRSNPTLKIEKAAMKQVHLHQVHLYLFTYSVAYKVWPLRASIVRVRDNNLALGKWISSDLLGVIVAGRLDS